MHQGGARHRLLQRPGRARLVGGRAKCHHPEPDRSPAGICSALDRRPPRRRARLQPAIRNRIDEDNTMPTIKLTDQFGLDVDVATGDLSSLAKYFGNFTSLSLAGFNLNSIAGLTLEDPAVTSIHAGLNFAQPVGIGSGGVTLAIFVPPADGGNLFDSDRYGDNIPVDGAERYVSIVLSTTAGPGINAAVNQLCFGFHAGATVSLANYRLFETHPTAPSILAAVQDTLANFCVPGGLDDLRGLAPGAVVTLEGTGTVSCSGSADLPSVANPLAKNRRPSP